MDAISLIITLLLLAAVVAAAYFAYNKIVVEGKLFETTTPEAPVVTQPSTSLSTPGEVTGGVPGVDNMRGRPGPVTANIQYYGGNDKLVPNGDAKTSSVCHEYAKSLDINNWGWDRQNKSCFSYIDSNLLTVMDNTTKVEGTSQYIVGCTESGVQILDGCMDFSKGDKVKGLRTDAYGSGTGAKIMTAEGCRAYANENGYDAFGYRTNRHNTITSDGSCFFYTDSTKLKGFLGDNTDIQHVSFCTDPTKKVVAGCQ